MCLVTQVNLPQAVDIETWHSVVFTSTLKIKLGKTQVMLSHHEEIRK